MRARKSMRISKKRLALGVVLSVVLVVGLIAFFEVPVIFTNLDGQSFFLGIPFTPKPTGVCAIFSCHCNTRYSLSAWLFGVGYRQVSGCP